MIYTVRVVNLEDGSEEVVRQCQHYVDARDEFVQMQAESAFDGGWIYLHDPMSGMVMSDTFIRLGDKPEVVQIVTHL